MSNSNNRDDIMKYQPLWGSWNVGELIGRGSFGSAYQVVREDLGHKFTSAVKILSIPSDEQYREAIASIDANERTLAVYFQDIVTNIVKEINLLYELRGNSNIISYEDHMVLQKQDNIGWDILIRMEYATSLPKYISQNTLTQEDVVRIGIDISNALSMCEKHGIIHRDIKDDNIFVAQNGAFKLGDFGIAKEVSGNARAATRIGTPLYMAPEVYRGDHYDNKVDIYALGIVLYKLMNNARMPFMPPFPEEIRFSDSEAAIEKRIRGEELIPPSMATPAFAEVILRACAFNPGDRFETANDMKRALEIILTHMQQVDASKVVSNSRPKKLNGFEGTVPLMRRPDLEATTLLNNAPNQPLPAQAPQPSTVQQPRTNPIAQAPQQPAPMSPMPAAPMQYTSANISLRKRKKNYGKYIVIGVLALSLIIVGALGLNMLGAIGNEDDEGTSSRSNRRRAKETTVKETVATDEVDAMITEASETARDITNTTAIETTVETTVSTEQATIVEQSPTPTTAAPVATTKPTPKPTVKPTPKPTVKPTPTPTPAPSLGTKVNNAPYWIPDGESYYEGSSVSHKSVLYVCVLAHTSQASWFPSKGSIYWKRVEAWTAGVTYKPGMYLLSGGRIYLCIEEHVSSQEIIPPNVQYWKKAG